MQRPLLMIALVYMFGLATGFLLYTWLPPSAGASFFLTRFPWMLLLVIFLASIGAGLYLQNKKIRQTALPVWLMMLLLFCASLLYGAASSYPASRLTAFQEKQATYIGTVMPDLRQNDESLRFTLQTSSLLYGDQEHFAEEKIMVVYKSEQSRLQSLGLQPGHRIKVRGKLSLPQAPGNPGEFDYQSYLWRQGIVYQLSAQGIDILSRELDLIWLPLKLRQEIEAFISKRNPDESGVINGILFGNQSALEEQELEVYRLTGVAHAFAVSGSNIAMVGGLVLLGSRLLRLSKSVSTILSAAVIVIYGWMTGFPPSVERAVVMALGGLMAYGLSRRTDGLTILAGAALVLLLWQPLLLEDTGFQLSFSAAWGLIYLMPMVKRWFFYLGPVALWVAVPLSAQLAVWPLIIWYFNLFSLIGLAANLLAALLISIITGLGLAIAVLFWPLPFLAGLLSDAAALASAMMSLVLKWLAQIPGAAWHIPRPQPWMIAAYFLFLILLREHSMGRLSPRVKTWLLRLAPLGAVLWLSLLLLTWFWPRPLVVTFVDVGQGDCIWIETPGGRQLLLDAPGPAWGNSAFDPGEKIVSPLFLRHGVFHLDQVINSHADNDHLGGLPAVLNNIAVEQLILSPPPHSSANQSYQSIKSLASQKQIQLLEGPEPGENLSPDPKVGLFILYPHWTGEPPTGLADNDTSLIMLLTYGNHAFLLTGDADDYTQQWLLNSGYEISAQVVKVPHHGSPHSLVPSFVKSVQNLQYAVFCVGRNNFGHPGPQVIDAWRQAGAAIYRTDEHGAIRFVSDGVNLSVTTTKKPRQPVALTNKY